MEKKMLLMGAKKVGKTSMHSETKNIGYTMNRQEHQYRLMGTLKFKLEDCPGQDDFIKGYFKNSVEDMVKDVKVLIYVFDISDNEEQFTKNLQDWSLILQNIEKHNQQAIVFVLLHKTDLIKQELLRKVIKEKEKRVREASKATKLQVRQVFDTSIYNESLYLAWSQIVQFLIPFQDQMKKMLKSLCQASLYSEVALLERQSYLVISYYNEDQTEEKKRQRYDLLRYEKIANILKQFKIVCNKGGSSNIEQIEINVGEKTGLITEFTKTQNIFVIYKEKEANKVLGEMNIKNLGKQFNLMKEEMVKSQ